MRKLIILAVLVASFQSAGALAAVVKAAYLDDAKKNLSIDVAYGGGCQAHQFSLRLEGCLESSPVQCTARLIELTDAPDPCEAYFQKTVKISLKEAGLADAYFHNGSLEIKGDDGSSATVTLP